MARFEDVKRDEGVPVLVFQRVCEGETLRQVAKAWRVPRGAFTEWYMREHGALYEAALKVRADELAHGALEVAEGSTPETVSADRLRVDTRLKVAGKWDRKRYGEESDGVRVTPVTIQIAIPRDTGRDPARELEAQVRPALPEPAPEDDPI